MQFIAVQLCSAHVCVKCKIVASKPSEDVTMHHTIVSEETQQTYGGHTLTAECDVPSYETGISSRR